MNNGLLYDPAYEHDACGVGLIVNVKGVKYRDIVDTALTLLENMAHRGAEGADSKSGDGAGIMVQIPHEFILLNGIPVPEPGRYGVGMIFAPADEMERGCLLDIIRKAVAAEGLSLIKERIVPVNSSILGAEARDSEPVVMQIFITGKEDRQQDVEAYERDLNSRLYRVQKAVEHGIETADGITDKESAYIVSLSTRTLIYKGMLTSSQLRCYFRDLQSPWFTSAMALVHSRFSTNTFPKWRLAQPFRIIAHNGEINTIKGNRLWMQARETVFNPGELGSMDELSPIVQPGMSDSASLDNTVEFFTKCGMQLPHTLAMMVPESLDERAPMSSRLKGFYEYHSIFMEPWDGPATILFSDGRYAGGILDRNGLRPCRYSITDEGTLILASETGVLSLPPGKIVEKGRLHPGEMIMVDLLKGEILRNDTIKLELANSHPYHDWLKTNRVKLVDIQSGRRVTHDVDNYEAMLSTFGYSDEDIDKLLIPMAVNAVEPNYAMGNDTRAAVLSQDTTHRFFEYFRQQFAQVTNPPIDPLREKMVMSLKSLIGAVKGNVLNPSGDHCKVVELDSPVITNTQLDLLMNLSYKGFSTITLDATFDPAEGTTGMAQAIDKLCHRAEEAVDNGCNYIIISDKGVNAHRAPIPSLLVTSAVHHHLIKCKKRTQTALIVETGEAFETMHIALLVGYGASAVNPYMVFAVLNRKVADKAIQLDYHAAKSYYVKAINKGMMKIISKMGISTLLSYRGAKLFDTLGISSALLDRYMGGGISPVEGIDLDDIATDTISRHAKAFARDAEVPLHNRGHLSWRKSGEPHAWNPGVVRALQKAVKANDQALYDDYVNAVTAETMFLRDLMEVKSDRKPIPLDEVESAEEIVKRFVVGAMSFGAISKEAHEDIAVAMNTLGGTSNTGEGGELPERFTLVRDGVSLSSAVKQVASGRFGVTTEYLVNATEIQIKVAQGAKPGEGGQLPGFKIDEMIARTRKSIPGITLISPPPHHDIYSIEDLAQLIYDLRNINPTAKISVKLVSESGIGTIAAGVVKAKADTVVVSGAEGGTGASPLSSVFHAGMPLETGLAEVQQTLMLNGLRRKMKLQVDGQLKTGRDVILTALMGAEEYGFSTAVLIVLGCIMDRKCNTNKCPVGLATQCAELRKKYKGSPQLIINFFMMLARDVRQQLAAMGYKSLGEIVGRSDLLSQRVTGTRLDKIKLDRLFGQVDGTASYQPLKEEPVPNNNIDRTLISATQYSVPSRIPITLDFPISNTDRSVGTMLSGEVTRSLSPGETLSETVINVNFNGSAGQSFGAFLCSGIAFNLKGDANDYLGKGLSGGRIVVKPADEAPFDPSLNIIAGNTLLYGATSGEVYINGIVGERFGVRNSGATAVVEGVGNHGCEYMTGGRVVVLGKTGSNFAAGMSGGVAYVYNPDLNFDLYCNMEMIELTLVDNEADNRELRSLIEAHHAHTHSPKAAEMLADWERTVKSFVKVTPIEYKKMLETVNNIAE